jgi:hypothetical protein
MGGEEFNMKDKNYIVIQGWMVNKLKLSGNELLIYAVIYGFSQDGESEFEYSGKYLADSCGISRRAVSIILEKLLNDNFILKSDYIKNNIKFCKYKVNFEFIPEDDKKEGKKGIEKDSIGGMENISIGRKNIPEGMEKNAMGYGNNFHGGMEKNANTTTNTTNNINLTTTTASDTPNSSEKPPPALENVVAASFSPEDLKKALLAVDRTFFLSDNFYPKAAAFMRQQALDSGYLTWLYEQCELKNPDSFDAYFFSIFCLENFAEKYKAVRKPASPPPPDDVKCPVCSAVHAKNIETCPNCSLPKDSSPQTIFLFRQLLTLPLDRRNEYLKKENVIHSEFKGDTFKISKMIDSLKKEFNIEANYEKTSRNYHP